LVIVICLLFVICYFLFYKIQQKNDQFTIHPINQRYRPPLYKKGKPTSWFTLYYTISPSGVNAEKELTALNAGI